MLLLNAWREKRPGSERERQRRDQVRTSTKQDTDDLQNISVCLMAFGFCLFTLDVLDHLAVSKGGVRRHGELADTNG